METLAPPKTIRAWKVYGRAGHRNKVSFYESFCLNFTKPGKPRVIECNCHDRTGTNDYVIIRITRATPKECYMELCGQLSDGIFENARTGKIIEVEPD